MTEQLMRASSTHSLSRIVRPVAVAIPARDEVAHIAACLRALDRQAGAQADHLVLCCNNTTDGTAPVARRLTFRPGTVLHILEPAFPPERQNAGTARRLAMDTAADMVGPDGVILTTDADAVVDPDWIGQNLAALHAGADAVAGWVDLDPQDRAGIPPRLHEDDASECEYDDLCDAIHACLDPDDADPLPRHTQHSGASIAVTARTYAMAGGMPAVSVAEDRAFFASLRRIDARIRHAPGCHVTVSGRLQGRAAGGMADTMRRRITAPDAFLDHRLEPADDCARRARMRHLLRACRTDPALTQSLADELGLDALWIQRLLQTTSFGIAWSEVEKLSHLLQRRCVAVADLPEQMARAHTILQSFRGPAWRNALEAAA